MYFELHNHWLQQDVIHVVFPSLTSVFKLVRAGAHVVGSTSLVVPTDVTIVVIDLITAFRDVETLFEGIWLTRGSVGS